VHFTQPVANKLNAYIEMNQGYVNNSTDHLFLAPSASIIPNLLSQLQDQYAEYSYARTSSMQAESTIDIRTGSGQ
jgi:hypothetical protein